MGNDEDGRRAVRQLSEYIDTSLVQVDPDRATGEVGVQIENGEARYTLHPGRAWERIACTEGVRTALSEAGVMVFGTLALGILAPLLLHGRIGLRRPWGVPAAAVCVLVGGLLLRYGTVTTPGELLRTGPSALVRFSPEQDRRVGQRGADIGNHGAVGTPRSKLPREP